LNFEGNPYRLPINMDATEYDLSPIEAAAILGVHEDTLKSWARTGKVGAYKTPGGWWRFRRADLDALVAAGVRSPATKDA